MYTVNRGVDLGQNLHTGSLKESSLAECFRKGLQDITVQDFAPYAPSDDQAMAFIAAPIVSAQLKITVGVVILKVSKQSLNTIVQRREGMGTTGETYLVGKDEGTLSLRSDQVVRGGKMNDVITGAEVENMLSGKSGSLIRVGQTGAIERRL